MSMSFETAECEPRSESKSTVQTDKPCGRRGEGAAHREVAVADGERAALEQLDVQPLARAQALLAQRARGRQLGLVPLHQHELQRREGPPSRQRRRHVRRLGHAHLHTRLRALQWSGASNALAGRRGSLQRIGVGGARAVEGRVLD
eukprot:6190407-Pleurochrysis_carterae.AAC.1